MNVCMYVCCRVEVAQVSLENCGKGYPSRSS